MTGEISDCCSSCSTSAALLPFEDNLFHLAHSTRDVADPALLDLVVPSWGRNKPVTLGEASHLWFRSVIADGQLCGFWEYDPDAGVAVPFCFRKPSKTAQMALEEQSAASTGLLRDEIGHGKSVGSLAAEEIRRRCRQHHMTLMDRIVTRLKSVPEGDGTMFDNTMVFYFPDGGETHHAHGFEFPFVVLSGSNTPLNIARRYIRLPYWGREGHKTLGNWYTTLLNAYGNPTSHFGAFDLALKGDQSGPIKEFFM